jgi:glycosyltransferase involved in cell wall biosynthesis
MKISIITVTYNSEQTLASAIESVLRQIYPVVEYMITFLLWFN